MPQDSSPQLGVLLPIKLSPLCQPFAQQRRRKMMVGHLDSCCLFPGGNSPGSFQILTLPQVDEISHQKLR